MTRAPHTFAFTLAFSLCFVFACTPERDRDDPDPTTAIGCEEAAALACEAEHRCDPDGRSEAECFAYRIDMMCPWESYTSSDCDFMAGCHPVDSAEPGVLPSLWVYAYPAECLP